MDKTIIDMFNSRMDRFEEKMDKFDTKMDKALSFQWKLAGSGAAICGFVWLISLFIKP